MQEKDEKTPPTTYCVNLFYQLGTKVDGSFRPCCNFSGTIVDDNGRSIHASTHSISDYFNTKHLKSLQAMALSGTRAPGCESCYHYESLTGQSKRLRDNSNFQKITEMENPSEGGKIKILDLRMGNLCNLGCVTCQPLLSSKLEKLWGEHGADKFSDKSVAAEIPLKHRSWYKSIQFVDEIGENSHGLVSLALVGGEPLINPHNIVLLKKLSHLGKKLKLSITSNIFSVSEDVLELLQKFDTTIDCSLDGIGPMIEYIRYPVKFEDVVNNYKRICEAGISTRIICTISVLNLFHIPESYQFYLQLSRSLGRKLTMSVGNLVLKPEHLAIRHLPEAYRLKAIQQLTDFYGTLSREHHDNTIRGSTRTLIKYLQNSKGDARKIRDKWKFIENYDQIRGNSWHKVAPHLQGILDAPPELSV